MERRTDDEYFEMIAGPDVVPFAREFREENGAYYEALEALLDMVAHDELALAAITWEVYFDGRVGSDDITEMLIQHTGMFEDEDSDVLDAACGFLYAAATDDEAKGAGLKPGATRLAVFRKLADAGQMVSDVVALTARAASEWDHHGSRKYNEKNDAA